MLTGGSTSVRAFEAPLREAGAAARALLCMAAARALGRRLGGARHRATASSGAATTGSPSPSWPRRRRATTCPTHLPIRGGDREPADRPAAAPARRARQDRRLGPLRRRHPAARHGLCRGPQRPAGQPARRRRPRRRRPRAGHARDLRESRMGRRSPRPTGGRRHARSTRCGRASTVPDGLADSRSIRRALTAALDAGDGDRIVRDAATSDGGFPGASPVDAPLRGRPRALARRSSR